MRLEFNHAESGTPVMDNGSFEDDGPPLVSSEFKAHLKNGIAAAQNGERQIARQLLTNASDIDPRNEDAWMWLASVSDYPEELLAFLNRVLEINPENQRAIQWHASTRSLLAKTLVHRAIAAEQEGSGELALQCLDRAIAYDEDCEIAWFWKASLSNSEAEKMECLDTVLRINANNTDARNAIRGINRSVSMAAFDEAKAAAVAGKRKKALEILNDVLQHFPDYAEAWMLKSHLSLRLEEKIQALEKVLEIDPENAAARSGFDFLTSTIGGAKVDAPVQTAAAAVQPSGNTPDEGETRAAPADEPAGIGRFGFVYPEIHAFETVETVYPIDEMPAVVDDSPLESQTAPLTDEKLESAPDETQDPGPPCPFCRTANDSNALECKVCKATLTLSDIESLFSNQRADRDCIQEAVTKMEAEWNLRDFNEAELTALGIGHFNLRNFEPGLKYLQEASRLNPNDVFRSGQVNAIAIRLDEISRQNKTFDAMPKGKTILVVDDSPTVRKLIAGKLEKSGHKVVCAVDGIEALERLAEDTPDLVLLDIAMPRLDGYEVCKHIRLNPAAKDIPVVLISGKDGFFDKVRGRVAGATAHVTKPFGPETLMKAIETYLIPDTPLPIPDPEEVS